MPDVLTDEQLRAIVEEADVALRDNELRHQEIAEYRAWALATLERRAKAARGLRIDGTERTISTMDVNTTGKSAAVKRGAARATRKHVAQQKFYEHDKTITEIAAELKETRERVSSWMKKVDPRPIPAHHVEYLHKKYGIPRNAWVKRAN
jgi:hypothetical protein